MKSRVPILMRIHISSEVKIPLKCQSFFVKLQRYRLENSSRELANQKITPHHQIMYTKPHGPD